MTEFRTKGKGANRRVYPITPSRSKRTFKTIKVKDEKQAGLYKIRHCKVCGVSYLLGPLDPDMDVCPEHVNVVVTEGE